MAVASLSLQGQVAERILTKSTMFLELGTGGVKFDYAGGIGPEGGRQFPSNTRRHAGDRRAPGTGDAGAISTASHLGSLHDTVIGGGNSQWEHGTW